MMFGDAIAALKKGERIARAGWNGKNMYLCHAPAQQGIVHIARNEDTQLRTFEPCVVMFTAQGTFQPGWLASQNDMLADDWLVLS